MTDLRRDLLFDRCVLVAEHRGERPNDFRRFIAAGAPTSDPSSEDCPFCAGHESQTPPAVYEKVDSTGAWRVRVVPNRYPAVLAESAGLAAGVHEVIIESPRHIRRSSDLSVSELADVLTAYRDRLRHWRCHGQFRYGLAFKNVGAAGGATLVHLHSQLMVLSEIPPAVSRELDQLERYQQDSGRCASCDRIATERDCQERVIAEDKGFVAFCPFASLQAFEIWLLPTEHQPSFEDLRDESLHAGLASALHESLTRVERLLPEAGYNVILHTAPWGRSVSGVHWRIEIRPRLSKLAGLELGTGIHINHVPPERAARQLKGV